MSYEPTEALSGTLKCQPEVRASVKLTPAMPTSVISSLPGYSFMMRSPLRPGAESAGQRSSWPLVWEASKCRFTPKSHNGSTC
jgi:hypothetical protein